MTKVKQLAGHSVSGIVVLIISVLLNILTGNEQVIGKLIGTILEETTTVPVESSDDGEIMTLVISEDGDILLNSDKLQLEGGLDFRGMKGDAIMIQKMDGVWVQIGKRLIEMEDF